MGGGRLKIGHFDVDPLKISHELIMNRLFCYHVEEKRFKICPFEFDHDKCHREYIEQYVNADKARVGREMSLAPVVQASPECVIRMQHSYETGVL